MQWCSISESSDECGKLVTNWTAQLQAGRWRCTNGINRRSWLGDTLWSRVCLEGLSNIVTFLFFV